LNTEAPITRRTFLKRSFLSLVGLFTLIGGYSYGVEPRWLEIDKKSIVLPRLPKAFHGLRVAVFGDLHVGYHLDPEDLPAIIDKVMEQKPDLILFTGDFVDDDQTVIPDTIRYLTKLNAPFGKFAVLGNHDYNGDQVALGLKQAGFQVLQNEHHMISKGRDNLVIAGVEDLLMGEPDLLQALEGSPVDTCTLLLSHCPDFADQIVSNHIDLQVSGHSHGGQIRLPLVGELITPPGGSQYVDGYYRLTNTQVYVNRGIGTTILPFRFNCRPQISLLELTNV
jgi:predicted MPP superfamily phosphohydrolase